MWRIVCSFQPHCFCISSPSPPSSHELRVLSAAGSVCSIFNNTVLYFSVNAKSSAVSRHAQINRPLQITVSERALLYKMKPKLCSRHIIRLVSAAFISLLHAAVGTQAWFPSGRLHHVRRLFSANHVCDCAVHQAACN